MKNLLAIPVFICLSLFSAAQKDSLTIEILAQGTNTSLRGLSVVNNQVIWVSGSNGTVGRSSNGGKDFKWMVVKGFEKTDFRDIEAFDASTAIIMGIGSPGYILRTTDGGETWTLVYENKSAGIFMDAMEFWNRQAGIVIGDPIDGKFFIARTFDNGLTWREIPDAYKPVADTGEACFAASGTNIRALDNDEAIFISGGNNSYAYIRDQKIKLPLVNGSASTGAYSIAVWDRYKLNGGKKLVVVGGDYTNDSARSKTAAYSIDRGKTWKLSKTPPGGYRSAVEFMSEKHLITCGPNGVDLSFDGGQTWRSISKQGFHAVRIARNGNAVFLAGADGKVARLHIPERSGKIRTKF
jgi:photosystem II stability/assembly factor-like uncharacterized protein